jgi:hypothetical protein
MISVFEVRLRCEAVPEIGCGVRAKPVLHDLEHQPGVGEAWLNRAGNLIAVVGTKKGCGSALEVLRRHRVRAAPLRGERLGVVLREFACDTEWQRAAEVDRLSEEEARVIARRLAARLRAKTKLPVARTSVLEGAIKAACAHELIHNPTQSAPARKRRLAKAILAAAQRHLDHTLLAAFADVLRDGHRPLAGEK